MNVEQYAKSLGLYVGTWAPGDGARRYRFFEEGCRTQNGEWVADFNQGDGIFTALGRKQAVIWLRGFASGKSA